MTLQLLFAFFILPLSFVNAQVNTVSVDTEWAKTGRLTEYLRG
ncbi:MAG TPA: hypothetical protein VFC67_18335 [Prolixibacteraceae bacterium]|nr:hypothetical protein [Prolixibacteraceae bacterium]